MTQGGDAASVPRMKTSSLTLACAFAAGLIACSEKKPAEPPPQQPPTQPAAEAPKAPAADAPAADAPAAGAEVTAAAESEAGEIFRTRCVTCHGADGKGDGPAAAALNPKPRSFADAAWQKTITDEHIDKIILGGGPAVGKSPLMPPNPDLEAKPQVVSALRAKVRSYAQ